MKWTPQIQNGGHCTDQLTCFLDGHFSSQCLQLRYQTNKIKIQTKSRPFFFPKIWTKSRPFSSRIWTQWKHPDSPGLSTWNWHWLTRSKGTRKSKFHVLFCKTQSRQSILLQCWHAATCLPVCSLESHLSLVPDQTPKWKHICVLLDLYVVHAIPKFFKLLLTNPKSKSKSKWMTGFSLKSQFPTDHPSHPLPGKFQQRKLEQ